MLLTQEYIKTVLMNIAPSIKPTEYQEVYFDADTFFADNNYLFMGVLNCYADTTITSIENHDTILKGQTNPVFFKNIQGANFTFLGFKIKYSST